MTLYSHNKSYPQSLPHRIRLSNGLTRTDPTGIEGSGDVGGGIGMNYRNGTSLYSAGDYIGCCQDTTGINRQARVEIYVR
jgi:hypothetical protein